MDDALSGVRVLDWSTGRAGPLAAMLLADFGAEVVKVEPPGGDPGRGSPGFAVWGRGKRSIVLDAATRRGASELEGLLAGCDVVVLSEPAAIEPERAAAVAPGAVVLHTPPSLRRVPWAGGAESDALISAWYGVPLRQGSFDGGPVDHIYPIVTTLQGIWAAACAVSALVERERSGHGQLVTVSGEHGVMIASAGALTFRTSDLEVPPARGGGPGGRIPFYRTYRCGDGRWLFFAALIPRFTQIGFGVLGLSGLFDDPRLQGRGRAAMIAPEHGGWVTEAIAQRFATAARDEWLARLREAGCPSGAVLDRDGWLDHPQIAAIGMRAELDDPDRGRVVMPGVPLAMSLTPGRIRGPAPALGSSPSPAWDARATPGGDGPRRAGPLDGVRVIDLGAIIAGPFAASLLGDLGAEVFKVEPPAGDSFRGPGFAAYNKGQRSIGLDLRSAAGREALLDLVRTADIVLDNYRFGVLERLRIDHARLAEVNPRVISASITAFGPAGPHRDDAGFDPVLQAMSGIMSAQGGDSDPVFYTVPVNDVAGSATLAFGAALALFHRERTGVAQRVTTSLAAMSALLQTEAIVRYAGRPPAPSGSRDHAGPGELDRFYPTTDGWIRVEAHGRAGQSVARLAGTGDPESAVAGLCARSTRAQAAAVLREAGVPAAPARRVPELVADPEVTRCGMLQRDPRPDRDGWTSGRHAVFSRTMRADVLTSPALGEHTTEILAELGYDDTRVASLIEEGAAVAGAEGPRATMRSDVTT